MKFLVRVQNVYNSVLDTTEKKLVVVKGLFEQVYEGALFFKLDAYSCLCNEPYDEIKLEEPNGTEICLVAYELLKANNMLKKGTLSTMLHWQYMNGVTDDCVMPGKFENDEELYTYLKGDK